MPDLLVRNLKPETMAFLKEAAARHGRSVQAEVSALIEEAEQGARAATEFWSAADALRARLEGRHYTDSAELIREDRDSDHAQPA